VASQGQIKVTAVGGTLTVTLTTPSGATPTVYADENYGSLSLPATITAGNTTSFYVQGAGEYNLSVKSGTVELANTAGTTLPVEVGPGMVAALTYDARLLLDPAGDSAATDVATTLGGSYARLSTANTFAAAQTFADGANIIAGTTTGTKIGTATTQKLGFFNSAPVVQPTALTAADASTVDGTYGAEEQAVLGNVRTRVNELETKLRALGLLA